jgi:cytoskeletal protein CcmA (bactofilin family)
VVFRKDAKTDTFQRQISALRQQLGNEDEVSPPARPASYPAAAQEYAPDVPVASSRFGAPAAPAYDAPEPEIPSWANQTADASTSTIAPETVWNGDLQATGPLHIRGKVEGSITSRSDIFIAEEADVEATITAENLAVAGTVRGSIRCSGRLEVLPAGRVNGDVFAQVLVVHEGATLNGQFSMTAAAPDSTVSPLRRRTGTAGA